jgi:tetratricopeptide (TPR) repeat protein
MLRRTLIALTMLTSLAMAGGHALAADPTMHDVYQAAEAGDYTRAQAMMDQVLRDHPNSAKAHFVEAELLAKQGRLSEAQRELGTAERLDPSLGFAKPNAVQELKARLTPTYAIRQPASSVPAAAGGFRWGPLLLLVGIIALVVIAIRAFRSRPQYAPQGQPLPGYSGGAAAAQPYGMGGVGPVQPGGGMGSSILGGLATGAAVGAGVVAGEALMHRVLDGHRSDDGLARAADTELGSAVNDLQPQYDMGGDDFGVSDSSSWDDDSSGGGDDWT